MKFGEYTDKNTIAIINCGSRKYFFSGQGVAVKRIIELVTHRTLYPEIQT